MARHRTDSVSATSFPLPEDLSWRVRAGVRVSAAADTALRTAAASLIAGTVVRSTRDQQTLLADVDDLVFYAELARRGDPDDVFVPPTRTPTVDVARRAPLPLGWRPGSIELKRFTTSYVALNPRVRTAYAAHDRNRQAWAQHWRHDGQPRPTIVVVHGFAASLYRLNRLFFSLPWFYGHGYDILLVTLPFHGRRKLNTLTYSGSGLFTGGLAQFNEAMLQAVHDLRSWLDHLLATGVPRVGVTGLSLGGYVSALLTTVDDRLWFAIPNAPVTHVGGLLETWFPAAQVVRSALHHQGLRTETFETAIGIHSPLRYPTLLDRERLFIIAGLGDRLAPPDQARALWEHWDRPPVHWFPGNHVLHIERGAYLKRMGRFLQRTGFGI